MLYQPRGILMRGIKLKYAVLLIALIATACSTPKPGTPEFVAKQDDDRQKAAVKSVDQSISKMPSWYTQPPVDANALYAAASESSPDMQMSMDAAILSAKRQLANSLGARVSELMNNYALQTGTGNDAQVVQEISRVAKSVTTDINLAGFVREKSEVIQEGRNFRTFVLLRYPVGETNRVVADQVKKSQILDTKVRAAQAFQDLEREIEAARKK
jgi:hypothetical protein